jgi:hypothetical protein
MSRLAGLMDGTRGGVTGSPMYAIQPSVKPEGFVP